MKWKLALAAATGATLLTGLASGAPSASGWSRLSDAEAAGSVGLARAANGTLHVLWARGANVYDTRVTASGKVSGRSTVISGWASTAGPAAVIQADGTLRAFVPGSINPADTGPAIGLHTLTARETGTNWTLEPEVWGGALANQRDVNGVLGKDGQPVTAVGGGGAVFFRGITDDQRPTILPPTPYSYDPEVASDSESGAIVGLWFVDQGGQRGIVAQSVFPQGPQKFLGKATDVVEGGISGRLGAPGTYVVLASSAGVRFGRFDGTLRTVSLAGGIKAVDVTAGPDGRLWLSWLGSDGRLTAARTNRAASRLGPPQVVKAPPGSPTPFELRGEGSAGPLDVIARYRVGNTLAWWQTHLIPTLTVAAKRSPKGVVTVTVTDVGDPVKGASVTVAGRKATTDSGGHAAFQGVRQAGTARVAAVGYAHAKDSYR